MEYTRQQKEALSAIETFLRSDKSVFILKGYAGTGKTTLLNPVISMAEELGKTCTLMAPTGRAAKVLSEKTGRPATTIHKAIYELSNIEAIEGSEREESKVEFRFPLRQMTDARRPGPPIRPEDSVLVIDESSMIGSRKTSGDLFLFGSGVLLDDLIRFARTDEGGKILFVGDPAQLAPIGDPDSLALDASYLSIKGLTATSFNLTEVIRQKAESTILSDSVKLRSTIEDGRRSELILERKQGEVEDIQAEDIAKRFCDICPTPSLNGPIVICYSNRMAATYNAAIREIYYPGKHDIIQKGDRLIIVGNNYSIANRTVLNGDFATVLDYSEDVEKQVGIVYMDVGKEKKERVCFELFFREVSLQFEDGIIIKTKIFENLLNNQQPNLTYQEQCALMSNFSMRHKELRANSTEYVRTLLSDPYYNAIRVKYGYAITCHKAQGGEWDTVFIDFSGRTGLSTDCLRWSYTAVSRARKRIFGHQLHNIPRVKAKVNDISPTTNAPSEYYPDVQITAGPFHNPQDPFPLKAAYWRVADALEGSGFRITGIEHKPFREIYSISDANGNTYKAHALYNKAGILRPFSTPNPSEMPASLLSLINGGERLLPTYSYSPSTQQMRELYARIQSACDANGIDIVNIVEHPESYRTIYYLQTDAYFASLDIYVNKSGDITYLAPRSEQGAADGKLVGLVESLRQ